MKMTAKQKEFWKNCNHRYNIKIGATRSGKTYLDYFLIPKRLREVSGKDGANVFLGNTKSTLQRNIIEPLQKIWGAELVGDIRSDNTALMFGEKVHCIGADKANQVDRIRGMSIKYCYGDEIVTWNEDVFRMLQSRLDKPYSKLDCTGNPTNPKHWVKKFIDRTDVDLFLQTYTLYDNDFVTEQFIKNLEAEYQGTVFFDRYILGKWANAEGLVFPKIANTPSDFIVSRETVPLLRWIEIGFDIGGNGSAYAMAASGLGSDGVVYVLKSQKKQAEDLPMEEVGIYAFNFINQIEKEYNYHIRHVNTDHSDVIINTLNKKRYIFEKCYKPPLEDRPFLYNKLLNNGKLKFVAGETADLIDELSTIIYDAKAERTIPLDDGSQQIDTYDSFTYSVSGNWNYL